MKRILSIVLLTLSFLNYNAQNYVPFKAYSGLEAYPKATYTGSTKMHPNFKEVNVAYTVRAEIEKDGMIKFYIKNNIIGINSSNGDRIPVGNQSEIHIDVTMNYTIRSKYGNETKSMHFYTKGGVESYANSIMAHNFFTEAYKEFDRSGNSASEIARLMDLHVNLDIKLELSSPNQVNKRFEKYYGQQSEQDSNASSNTTDNQEEFEVNNSSNNSNGNNNSDVPKCNGCTPEQIAEMRRQYEEKNTKKPKSMSAKDANEWQVNQTRKNEANNSHSDSSTIGHSSTSSSNSTDAKSVSPPRKSRKQIDDESWNKIQNQIAKNQEKAYQNELHLKRNLNSISSFAMTFTTTSINISTINSSKSPQEVIENLKQIQREVAQKKRELDVGFKKFEQQMLSNTPTSSQQAKNNLGVYVAGAVGNAGVQIAADVKANKARKEADKMLDRFRAELNTSYTEAINVSLEQAVFSFQESEERAALNSYFYYTCVQKSMNSRFTHDNADWAVPSSSCDDDEYSPGKTQRKNSKNYLETARRKYDLYVRYNNYAPFKEASELYTNKSIEANPKFVEAFIYRSSQSSDPINKYADALQAKNLSGRRFKYAEEFSIAEEYFNRAYYDAIDNEDIGFLKSTAISTLYPSKENKNGSPIHYSIAHDKSLSLHYLIGQNKKMTESDLKGYLLLACENDSRNVFNYLTTQRGVSVAKKDYKGLSPIESAFYGNSKKVFGDLVEMNIDYTMIREKEGFKKYNQRMSELLFYSAIEKDDMNLFEESLSYYKNTDQFYMNLINEMLTSATNKVIEKVSLILTDKNSRDYENNTLVHLAVRRNNYPLLRHLFNNQFSAEQKNNYGRYPVDYLIELENDSKILNNLSEFSFNYNYKDAKGVPFIHQLLHQNEFKLDKFLTAKEIDLDIQGLYGWSLLHYAAKKGDVTSVDILINNGANRNVKDKWGRKPIDVCKEQIGADKLSKGSKLDTRLRHIKRRLNQEQNNNTFIIEPGKRHYGTISFDEEYYKPYNKPLGAGYIYVAFGKVSPRIEKVPLDERVSPGISFRIGGTFPFDMGNKYQFSGAAGALGHKDLLYGQFHFGWNVTSGYFGLKRNEKSAYPMNSELILAHGQEIGIGIVKNYKNKFAIEANLYYVYLPMSGDLDLDFGSAIRTVSLGVRIPHFKLGMEWVRLKQRYQVPITFTTNSETWSINKWKAFNIQLTWVIRII